ncbi:PLP-dependent aminotransferase family protein [Streptomyces sp. NPDC046909]|uniref:aminotransferase-like domain-containing protein n=1 Tax=Streptomyces sp. NPDC046909 TaxID=3155617 RepID=UPI0033D8DBC9
MEDYRRIADRLAADIEAGRLKPGERLPPQRQFARRRGIAGSTAGRVYGELVRRGLVVGEVGRGTFVRAAPAGPTGRALTEDATRAPVNMELNYPTAPGQSELLAPVLEPLLRPDVLAEALLPAAATGTAAARAAAADVLAPGWRPDPACVLFTGNARQAIAATLASLVRPGGRVGVEELTYPLVKEIAARLGIALVPLAGDVEGPLPEAVAAAHRTAPLSALYLQPTLHNPTSLTVGRERRRQLAAAVADLGLPVVEDRIWSFLHSGTPDSPGTPDPLATHAPGLTHVVDSLSKRVAPGLTVGFVVAPRERLHAVAAAIRSGGWSAGRFALEAAVRVTGAGVVRRLVESKRADAAERQRIVAEELEGLGGGGESGRGIPGARGVVRAHPQVYYAWWELPAPWRADTFAAAAAAHGIAVTPGPAFAVDPSRTPDAVRLGLASTAVPDLRRALRTLAGVARTGP